ncbi:MAG: 50S ribosomal protein L21 [Candidatus Ratteibacteria bacterium]|nr:50S ribosomal protein L21 [Candidatus Ratteibacteria bacterium]
MDVFVEIGGKQIRVNEGTVFSTLKIKNKKVGDQIKLTPVCCIGENEIITGGEKLQNVEVICNILEEKKGKKVYSFKKKPKTGYKRGYGHRDRLMILKVSKIETK